MHEASPTASRGEEAHPSQDQGPTLREAWGGLTEAEHRVLDALVRRAPTARNVNEVVAEHFTPGQRLADAVTDRLGSWPFIVIQSLVLVAWLVVNSVAWRQHWDPVPVHPAQPGALLSGRLQRADHHDESEPANGERPPTGGGRLRGQPAGRAGRGRRARAAG